MIENPESSPDEDPGEAMRPPGEEGDREEAGGAEAGGAQSDGPPMKRIDEDVSGDEETEDFDDVESGDLCAQAAPPSASSSSSSCRKQTRPRAAWAPSSGSSSDQAASSSVSPSTCSDQ